VQTTSVPGVAACSC